MNLNNLWDRKKDVSIIIPCRNEGEYLRMTIDSLISSKNILNYEIIVVNDGSSDGCCDFLLKSKYRKVRRLTSKNLGVAGAKNFGAKEASGEYLFFCDAHVLVKDWWIDSLTYSMQYNNAHAIVPGIKEMSKLHSATGYGETWDQQLNCCWCQESENKVSEIPIAPGGFFGISKAVFYKIGGFEGNFKIWGREDEEISLRLWLFGYKSIVDGNVEVEHLFKIKNEYGVTSYEAMYNLLFMTFLHFETENLIKVIQLKKNQILFPQCFSEILLNRELIKKREYYLANRVYNEKYFFEKFKIKLIIED